MIRRICPALLLAWLAFFPARAGTTDSVRITALRVEYRREPLGVDEEHPRFSWRIETRLRGLRQVAWQVEVASSEEDLLAGKADMWNSGQVVSDTSIQIEYRGRPLESNRKYFWRVRIWDNNGVSHLSAVSFWRTGLFHRNEWKAFWIGLARTSPNDAPVQEHRRLAARYLRKEFHVRKPVREATAFVSGVGLFEFYLNGRKVGRQVLAPALSEYDKRCYYLTFDVTPYLQEGQNAAGLILGNGRFFAPRLKEPTETRDYGLPRGICQIMITYEDGSQDIVISDTLWRVTDQGPIRANNEYDGEEYDARREMDGWALPGFKATGWESASFMAPPSPVLQAQPIAPIIVADTLTPVTVTQTRPGVYLFDMGQNMVGWVRLRAHGKRGGKIVLRFAERLRPDSTLYTDNLRGAQATDVYILRGEGEEVWQPRFTYHGFRYVEVTGFPGTPDHTGITGMVVHDDLERTGTFHCSNPLVNRIYRNAFWGIRSNYRSIPTDCPQRDERQGWLGDRNAESTGESYLFDVAAFYNKWLTDMEDAQRPDGSIPDVAPSYWPLYNDNTTWAGTFLFIADMLYTQYGDLRAIRKHYPAMRRWMQHMSRYVRDGIMTRDTYGDWCAPPNDRHLVHTRDAGKITPGEYIATAYYFRELMLMSRFAALLDHKEEAFAYTMEALHVRNAFNDRFFDAASATYANNTVTASLLALAFGLTPPEQEKRVVRNLLEKLQGEYDTHVANGIIGGQWLLRTLTATGHGDIAWQLVSQKSYPSWGYMVQQGATTIWELWNGNTGDPSMNSGNHVMLLGDLIIWLYEELAGIHPDPLYPGFRHIILKPYVPDNLHTVSASFRSPLGMIRSSWQHSGEEFIWDLTIPGNTLATLYIPVKGKEEVLEGGAPIMPGQGLHFKGYENGFARYEAGSGEYHFTTAGVTMSRTVPYVPVPVITPSDTFLTRREEVRITIHCRDTLAQVRYTFDGSEPSLLSARYLGPLVVDRPAVVRARAFREGAHPSVTTTAIIDFANPQINGVRWTLYPLHTDRLPDFSSLQPSATGRCLHLSLDELPVPDRYFAVRFTGRIWIDLPGTHTFSLTSNDGSRLWIDGHLVVDNDGLHAAQQVEGNIYLEGGFHHLTLDYFQGGGSKFLKVQYRAGRIPQQRIPASRLYPEPNP